MKWTEEEKKLIVEQYYDGLTFEAIAANLNRTVHQVSGWLRRNLHRLRGVRQQVNHQVQVTRLEKPTPETVTIQYEFTEYDMPEDALMIPFKDVVAGQCGFLSGTFWDESGPETPCCGKPVYDPKGKGLRRQYCEFHYKISVEEVK